ncbi:MAG TPA: VanW family protein [Polyangiaceae bacterium]|nr:VanW family protein [Polyangiaceae bacterium]
MDRQRPDTAEQAAASGGEPASKLQPTSSEIPPEQPEKPSARARRPLFVALLALAPILALLLVFGADRVARAGEVLRGVTAGGVLLAGTDRAGAERALTELGDKLRAEPLRLRLREQVLELRPEDISFRVDAAATADQALAAGRTGGVLSSFGFWLARFRGPLELDPITAIDRPALDKIISEWEGRGIIDPPFEGAIFIERGETPKPDYPRSGYGIDRDAAARLIEGALRKPAPRGEINLPLIQASPRLSREAVDRALEQARALLAGPVDLVPSAAADPAAEQPAAEGPSKKKKDGAPETAEAPPEVYRVRFLARDLAAALKSRAAFEGDGRIELAFDPAVIDEKLAPFRPRFERKPRDASFSVDDRDRITINPSSPGARLDAAKVAAAFFTAALSPSREAPLPIEEGDPPELSTEAATALHIDQLVSKHTTYHPCCQARVKNIHRIADLVDGRIVRPGETFSLNAAVGERTAKNGFVMAPGIEDGEMVDTMGGGVSQFATTFFNAMFHGGYDIIERQPHSFYFSRYPMGHEATLSWPKPDLVIRNDTDAGILIKAIYSETSISVKLYGNNGGRKVKAKVSNRYDITKPPLELLPSAKLLPDDSKVKESGSVGWSVMVARIITFPDGTKKEERRKVTYKPRVRRVEVHPCRIPEGEPGHTGEKCPKPEEEEDEKSSEGATSPTPAPPVPEGAAPF